MVEGNGSLLAFFEIISDNTISNLALFSFYSTKLINDVQDDNSIVKFSFE